MHTQKQKRSLALRLAASRRRDQRFVEVAASITCPKCRRTYLTPAEFERFGQSRLKRLVKRGGKVETVGKLVRRKHAERSTPRTTLMLGQQINTEHHPEMHGGEYAAFVQDCTFAGIEATDRQLLKWRAGRGIVRKMTA